jgi:hypothetical protein
MRIQIAFAKPTGLWPIKRIAEGEPYTNAIVGYKLIPASLGGGLWKLCVGFFIYVKFSFA